MTTGNRKIGEFCWINMLTPEPDAARAFFSQLLGWTYKELPGGMGWAIQVGGKDVGGLFDLHAPNTPKGTPPGIGVMVKVASADDTVKRIRQLGGRAEPAFDVMDQGRMAVCFDPTGAAFDLWQPMKGAGMAADPTHHGAPSWFETTTTDAGRATKFYTELFGWTAESMEMPGFTYTSLKLGDAWVAGIMPRMPEMGDIPPHWAVYFTVKDVDATEAAATKLGANVCVPAVDIPGVGRFCGIISPQGVMCYAMTYAPM